jgi:hypothetical protein
MFPNPGDKAAVTDAQRICATCPVVDECLTAALAEEGGRGKDTRFGIRGGLTPSQRHALYNRHRMRRAAA